MAAVIVASAVGALAAALVASETLPPFSPDQAANPAGNAVNETVPNVSENGTDRAAGAVWADNGEAGKAIKSPQTNHSAIRLPPTRHRALEIVKPPDTRPR